MSSQDIPIESGDDLPHHIDRETAPEVIYKKGESMRSVYKGMIIKTASPTGGKAGKGFNKTSTVQVIDPAEWMLKKQIRFIVGDRESIKRAWKKAKDFIDGKTIDDRGGAREGAGIRKEPLEGGEFTVSWLDAPTRETMETLGNGNRSKGIRRAAKIVSKLPRDLIDKLLKDKKEEG